MQKNIVLIGGGGHCKACIDVIEKLSEYTIAGILDRPELVGAYVLGHKIIGSDADIQRLISEGCTFIVTVGQIKSAALRKRIFQNLIDNGAIIETIVSPLAYISNHSSIGIGSIVMHGAYINAGVTIGSNCILNTSCVIEHDVVIGEHTHISTKAVINGNCSIGDEVFIGSNSAIGNQLTVGNNIVIGVGAVTVKSIDQPGTYVGNPLKKIG